MKRSQPAASGGHSRRPMAGGGRPLAVGRQLTLAADGADSRPTLGRLWADFGPPLGSLWADFGPTLGRLWADF